MHLVPLLLLTLTGSAALVSGTGTAAPSTTGSGALVIDDATITDLVRAAIGSNEAVRYDAANVHVSTRDGIVTLSCFVHRETIRKRMEQIAHAVRGVVRVANLITVEPNA